MAIHDDNRITVVPAVPSNAYEVSLEFVEGLTSKCEEIQQKVLIEILNQNANTEYLKRYNVSHGSLDRETFKANVPIVTYEDIKDDILRMYNDDSSSILCAQPISEFWLSSGTSGGQLKLFPATEDDKEKRDMLLTSVMPFIKGRIEGPEGYKGKGFSLIITRDETKTPNGKILCSGMNSVFKNPKFYNDKPYPNNFNTSPLEAIYCSDHFQSVYTQLLCGFYQRHEVTHAKAVFGSTLLWIMHFLKSNCLELCSDISSGTLNPKIVDPSLRAFMVKTFVHDPNPELAKVIIEVCSKDDWEGIFKKIWPNIKYVETVITGSMAQYIPMLNYYSGGLPLVSVKYSASECDLGFNLNPMCDPNDISYTIMPNMAYYEFIPLEVEDSTSFELETIPQTVDLAKVEIGKEYELLITTYCGLYRYKMGDVLTPTSFYNSTPQFKFSRRRNVILAADIAKTTEVELQNGIDSASSLLRSYDTKIVEYTSYADVNTVPVHYIIYMELMTTMSQENLSRQHVLEHCCLAMEECLGLYYRSSRADEAIGPLEIRVVSNGAFEKMRDYAISRGASFLQFKVPRCVKSLPMLELLESCVISTHFSPSVPCKST